MRREREHQRRERRLRAVVPSVTSSAAPRDRSAATVDNGSALVELTGDPLSVSPRTKPGHGARIDFSSNA